jgi:hypothetical protein
MRSLLVAARGLVACLLLLATSSCERKGCTNLNASNFDFDAQTDDGSCIVTEVVITQAQLNAVTTRVLANITGNSLSPTEAIAHVGSDPSLNTPLTSYRDIYSSIASLTGTIPVGTIITKRTHVRNTTTGAYGPRRDVIIMVKQPKNYFPQGGDWQYIAIPQSTDSANVNSTYPNGLLSRAASKGRLSDCAACHARSPNGTFLFTY